MKEALEVCCIIGGAHILVILGVVSLQLVDTSRKQINKKKK